MADNLIGKDRLRALNALARRRKYGDLFDIDTIPEAGRRAVAEDVAQWVAARLAASPCAAEPDVPSSCGGKQPSASESTSDSSGRSCS